MIGSSGGYYIDPRAREELKAEGSTDYLSYWKKDFDKTNTKVFEELPPLGRGDLNVPKWNDVARRKSSAVGVSIKEATRWQKTTSGAELRTYRLALAATAAQAAAGVAPVAREPARRRLGLVRAHGLQ